MCHLCNPKTTRIRVHGNSFCYDETGQGTEKQKRLHLAGCPQFLFYFHKTPRPIVTERCSTRGELVIIRRKCSTNPTASWPKILGNIPEGSCRGWTTKKEENIWYFNELSRIHERRTETIKVKFVLSYNNLKFPDSDISVAQGGTYDSNPNLTRHWRGHYDLLND